MVRRRLMAPAALGLFCASSHADGGREAVVVTERSNQNPPQRHQPDDMPGRTSDRSLALPGGFASGSRRHADQGGMKAAARCGPVRLLRFRLARSQAASPGTAWPGRGELARLPWSGKPGQLCSGLGVRRV